MKFTQLKQGESLMDFSQVSGRDIQVFYHGDLDGKTSAAIIKRLWPDAFCVPVNHNKDPNWSIMKPGGVLFVVDFSFSYEIMQRLNQEYKLIWIDHHDPIVEYGKLGFNPEGNRAIIPGKSGAMLVWEFLHPNEECPRFIKYVSDYDTWMFKYPETLYFSLASGLLDLEFTKSGMNTWNELFDNDTFIDKLVTSGKKVQLFIDERAKLVCKDIAFKTTINGKTAYAGNIKNTNSLVLKCLSDSDPDTKLTMLYCYFGNIKKWRVSIYSSDEEHYNAAEICRAYNGNGRGGAAGFVSVTLPFKLPTSEVVIHEDALNRYLGLKKFIQTNPLINKYAQQSILPAVTSTHIAKRFLGFKTSMVNHPTMFRDAFYDSGLNFYYDIGIMWTHTSSGNFRWCIFSLSDSIDLQNIKSNLENHFQGRNDGAKCLIKECEDMLWVESSVSPLEVE